MESTGPATRSRRRTPYVVVGVVVVAAAVAGVVVLTQRAAEEPAPRGAPCDVPSVAPSGVTAGGGQAPGGGGLRVVEQGFTAIPPAGSGLGMVSLGAVVENTSGRVAYRARVTFRVRDARDASVVPDNSGELLVQQIPAILPGQRVGVGAWTYLRADGSGRPVEVAGFAVEFGPTQWLPREENADTFAQLSARHQHTERSTAAQHTATLHYSVESAYCRALTPRGVGVVFRDTAGTVVGGSFQTDNARRCEPGVAEQSISQVMGIPATVDDGRTEVYPYCDVAPGGAVDPSDPDAPVNY